MSQPAEAPVLVLGAGVNGAAVARELVLNGVPVWLVDLNDLACGATSRSSRLIHGGLRYLEYGEFRLVRESLDERSRLRRLAPHFVEPLRLYIPVAHRTGGLWQSIKRFLWRGGSSTTTARGLWLVRAGLRMYDGFVDDPAFPRSRVCGVGSPQTPLVNAERFRWLCAYTDAHMRYPERFVLSTVADAQRAADECGVELRVLTYHRAHLSGETAVLRPVHRDADALELRPAAVVNATGAWGDLTLQSLDVPSPRLFGGTKGSHFFTHHAGLRAALGEGGLYAEASDGRLVFVLPFDDCVMVGTTDERFEGSPDEAVATANELDYLLAMTNELFPDVELTRDAVEMHYAGVRPLPNASGVTAAVSRDHHIQRHESAPLPLFTLVGGKLTTARAFGEIVADTVLAELGRKRQESTRDRPWPGAEGHPETAADRTRLERRLADRHHVDPAQIAAMWSLCGSQTECFLAQTGVGPLPNLDGTRLPLAFAQWIVDREWVTTLCDLVERRLMLVYSRDLSDTCLRQLAEILVEAGRLDESDINAAVQSTGERLRQHYGKRLRRAQADGMQDFGAA